MSAAESSHDPALRVMSLHALLYCERLFYLEEVEGIRRADAKVYAGRELHTSLDAEAEQMGHAETLDLLSDELGLAGKVDVVKRRDGAYVPYEHKRGRCRRGADDEAQTWESDRIQASAYALMIEQNTGQPVNEARVRYHADGVTVRVPIDEAAREAVRKAVAQARDLRQSLERPPVTENENLCRSCSLAPICLPEETRQAERAEPAARNLFPAHDERTSLHVVAQGARVGRSGDRLVMRPKDGDPTHHPSREIGSLVLHGFAQISTQAIRLCADQQIALHWVTTGGKHTASLTNSVGQVHRRIRQYQALHGPDGEATCLNLAKRLVTARIDGQRRYLLRATRADAQRRERCKAALRDLDYAMEAADGAQTIDSLRGHEGDAARCYWRSFNDLLADSVPETLRYSGRSRRPADDRVSAVLNFGYALLKTAVMRAILTAGLEPSLGFYHTARSEAHPLVLDLMEPFRLPLWDMVVVGSLNRGQWDPDADFQVTKAGVWLGEEGRKKAIGLFEQRLEETWKHPVVGYSLNYARTLELEARLLEKEWAGDPGLFAQLRLR